jgi:hypothetical protein
MLLERGADGPGLNFNPLLLTKEAKGDRSADFYALNNRFGGHEFLQRLERIHTHRPMVGK